jgi:hypothetical protein
LKTESETPDPEERIRLLEESNRYLRERLEEEKKTSEARRDEAVRWQGIAEKEHRSWIRVHDAMNLLRQDATELMEQRDAFSIYRKLAAVREERDQLLAKRQQWRGLARRATNAKAEEAQRARDLEAVVDQLKEKVTEVEQQRDDVEATARKTIEGLTRKIDRIADQTRLWNRGELDTMTTIAGIAAEMNGYPLPEPGAWERAKAQRAAEILSQNRKMSLTLETIEDVLEEAGFGLVNTHVNLVRSVVRYIEQQQEQIAELREERGKKNE